MDDVVGGQQLGELGLESLELSELGDVGELRRVDVPSSAFVRMSASITRMVPASTRANSSVAISPVKLLAPAGNSTTT